MAAVAVAIAPQPFDLLFATEYRRVVSAAYRVLGDRNEAEDVAQDVFAQCARARRHERPGASGWLHVAAVHRALNVVRSRRRRIERELMDFRLAHALRANDASLSDPSVALDHAHERLLVRVAMSRLATRDAELLALRYGGATYQEIAQTLNIDDAQIGMRLARARHAFKKEIERAIQS